MTTATKLTYEDYVKLPDDGKRYEIIDGELYVNPAPAPRHQTIVVNFVFALRLYFTERGGGKVWASPIDVLLGIGNVVQPDVIVVMRANAPIVNEKNVAGAPDIAIEVMSGSTQRLDEVWKKKLYEQAGVREYWMAYPEAELVRIYRLSGTTFERPIEINTEIGGTITTPLLPGFALDINAVFAE